MTRKELSKRFFHLRKFYNTKREYEQHLFSGEVKVAVVDLIKILK